MRVPLRKTVFWMHLTLALSAGLVILVMSVTGVLLTFEAQVMAWADRDARRLATAAASRSAVEEAASDPVVSAVSTGWPLSPASLLGAAVTSGPPSPASLLGAVRAARPELSASALGLRRDPGEAATLSLGRDGSLYVDPRDGAVLGPGASGARRFFRVVTDVHRALGASGDRRALGQGITGAANLAFLFILVSGSYLWLPRVWSRLRLRNALWFRRGLGGRARDFNWHHVLGIWSLLPLLLIVASALPISYDWAGDLVIWATGSSPASGASANGGGAAGKNVIPPGAPRAAAAGSATALAELDLTALDVMAARAAAEVPDWQSLTFRLAPTPDGSLAVTADRATRRGRPDLRVQLVFDRTTGELRRVEPFASQSLGRRARSWMRWIHTGEAGGLPGQGVALLVSGATAVLVWTGFALAWRRWRAWQPGLRWARSRLVRSVAEQPEHSTADAANDERAAAPAATLSTHQASG